MEILNTIKLLRFPFSIFLLPVTLFSFYYIQPDLNYTSLMVLAIWHLLVFPSSNGYNGYHDADEGPVGGLAKPPKPVKLLIYASNVFDLLALVLSLSITLYFSFFVLVYIIASRLYSNRSIRLEKYPFSGFLIVFIFQGAWIFYANLFAFSAFDLLTNTHIIYSAIACSFLIATVYPLTQIYQHKADEKDGVRTLSMLLGIKGTFVFAGLMFLTAGFFLFLSFLEQVSLNNFLLFNVILLPSTLFFLVWGIKSFKNEVHVNFKNTMAMLIISSLLTNIYFLILLFN